MSFSHIFHVFKAFWNISCRCWPGSVTGGGLSANRRWLRRFLLLKLVTVLLFPHVASLPLLVGCVFSLRAFLLLRSPRVSTKPSTVLLGQLALTDGLVLVQWGLRLAAALAERVDEAVEMTEETTAWWKEAASSLCQQLLDAHHLASLLLLGLLGLEATLVSRWPQQTRRLRTSQWTQISCGLVWMFVLLELACSLRAELLQKSGRGDDGLNEQDSPLTSSNSMTSPSSLPTLSLSLRRMLWMVNSWMHFAVFKCKPQRRKSSFH